MLVTEPEGSRHNVLCVRPTPEHPQPGRRLLLRYDEKGLWLFCRFCKQEHAVAWERVEEMREESGGD